MATIHSITVSDKETAHLERWAARTNAEQGTTLTVLQFMKANIQAWIDNIIVQNRIRRQVKIETAYHAATDAIQTSVLSELGIVDD